jgi:hypothetical protein
MDIRNVHPQFTEHTQKFFESVAEALEAIRMDEDRDKSITILQKLLVKANFIRGGILYKDEEIDGYPITIGVRLSYGEPWVRPGKWGCRALKLLSKLGLE